MVKKNTKIIQKNSKIKIQKKNIKKLSFKKINKNIDNKLTNFKTITIILLIIVILLFGLILITYLYNNNSKIINVKNILNFKTSQISLLIIDDENCINCKSDLYATQIKNKLITNLKINKISINSKKGKFLIKKLNLNQVPIFIFSESIKNAKNWSLLKNAFIKKKLNNITIYLIDPKIIPNKILINEPQILDGAVILGNKNAKVTIYEFSDFECPLCGLLEGNAELVNQFKVKNPNYIPPIPKIITDYINTGKVKLVFYNMPLEQLHPNVKIVHLAALCANEQGKWFEYKNNLFLNRSDWIGSNLSIKLKFYAKNIGLNQNKFNNCLDSKKYNEQINNEINYGISLGVSKTTSSFFIGKYFLSGFEDFKSFQIIIEKQLSSK